MCQFAEIWGGPSVMPLVTKEICSPVASETENASLSNCSPLASKLRLLDNDRLFPASMADGLTQRFPEVKVGEFLSLSFSHHMEIIAGTDSLEERLFYIQQAAQNRWGKRQLRRKPPCQGSDNLLYKWRYCSGIRLYHRQHNRGRKR